MRWCFIFLVFANVFFFIWQSQQPIVTNISTSPSTKIDSNAKKIILLKEQPKIAVKKITLDPAQMSPEQQN